MSSGVAGLSSPLASAIMIVVAGVVFVCAQLPKVLEGWTVDALELPGPAALIAGIAVVGTNFVPSHLRRRVLAAIILATLIALTSFVGVAASLLMLSCAAACGTLLLSTEQSRSAAALVAATVVGLAVIGAIFSVLLPFPVNRPWLYALLLLAPIALRHRQLKDWLEPLVSGERSDSEGAIEHWARFLAATAGLAAIAGVLYPIVTSDDVVYHLRLPTQLLHHGRYSFDVRYFLSATNPFAADLWFAIPYVASGGDDDVHAVVRGFYSLASAVLLWDMVRASASRSFAWMTVALFFSPPMTHYLNHSMHAELPMVAFALTGFWLIFRAVGRMRLTALALTCGGLIAIKLSGLALVAALAALGAWRAWREKGLNAAAALQASAAGLAVGLPAYVWSYKLTGNPVFPLFNHIFKSPLIPAVESIDSRWTGKLDWTFLLDIYSDTPKFAETAQRGASDAALLILAPAALLLGLAYGSFLTRAAIVTCLLHGAMIVLNMQYIRYLFPAVAILLIAIGSTMQVLAGSSRWRRVGVTSVVTLTVVANLMVMSTLDWSTRGKNVWAIATDPEAQQAYVVEFASMRLVAQQVNALLGNGHKLLMMGGIKVGELAPPTVVAVTHLSPEPGDALRSVATPVDAVRFLKKFGITHALVSPNATTKQEEHAIVLFRMLGQPVFSRYDWVLYDMSQVHYLPEQEAASTEASVGKLELATSGFARPWSTTSVSAYTSDLILNGTENPAQLLVGFLPHEDALWRWAFRRFAVLLATPPGASTAGAIARLEVGAVDSMLRAGPITVTAKHEERILGTATIPHTGQHLLDYEIPPALMSTPLVRLTFEVDKFFDSTHGLIVSRITLLSR